MPELPEVETIAQDLGPLLRGRTVVEVTVRWPRHVARPEPQAFRARLRGRRILAVSRRGKFLHLQLSSGASLLVHLKMTGRLQVLPARAPSDPHEHTVLHLDGDEELRFRDWRKFGRLYLVDDAREVLGSLGPEPFDPSLTAVDLRRRLQARRRRLKPLLLDQSFLAGLGNIYADEALWEARLHPLRRSDTLSSHEVRRLQRAIRRVLRRALGNRGTTLLAYRDGSGRPGLNADALRAYGREAEPCPRCGAPLRRLILGGRSTYFCPRCQIEGPAADEHARRRG